MSKPRQKIEQALFLNIQNKDLKIVKKAQPSKQQVADQSQIEEVADLQHGTKLNSKAVKVLLNEEVLATQLKELAAGLKEQKENLKQIEVKMFKRCTYRQLAEQFERIVKRVDLRVLGEKVSKFKLGDPEYLSPDLAEAD